MRTRVFRQPVNSFLVRHRALVIVIYFLGWVAGMISVDTPYNAPYYWAFRYLSAPLLIAGIVYTYRNRDELIYLAGSAVKVYAGAFAIIALCILFSAGWINFVNILWSRGEPVLYQGQIVRKFTAGSRSPVPVIEIFDETLRKPIAFTVSESCYDSCKEGDRYARRMQIGWLGIPFQLRRSGVTVGENCE